MHKLEHKHTCIYTYTYTCTYSHTSVSTYNDEYIDKGRENRGELEEMVKDVCKKVKYHSGSSPELQIISNFGEGVSNFFKKVDYIHIHMHMHLNIHIHLHLHMQLHLHILINIQINEELSNTVKDRDRLISERDAVEAKNRQQVEEVNELRKQVLAANDQVFLI